MAEENENPTWEIEVQENEDSDLFIELTDDIIEATGLCIGEKLLWELLGDDSYLIRRSDDYA